LNGTALAIANIKSSKTTRPFFIYHAKITPLDKLRLGVLNGTIPSAVSNTGATSHALLPTAPSILTGTRSNVVFHLPNGATASSTTINKLQPRRPGASRSANIVPDLATNSLMSISKFVDARYTVVYNDKEVDYYEKAIAKTVVSEDTRGSSPPSPWMAMSMR
jgi:hypothetical protein